MAGHGILNSQRSGLQAGGLWEGRSIAGLPLIRFDIRGRPCSETSHSNEGFTTGRHGILAGERSGLQTGRLAEERSIHRPPFIRFDIRGHPCSGI